MFDNDTSSSSSTERTKTPFNAVKEAADAISRRKLPPNPDLQKEIEHIFSQPVKRDDARKEPRRSRYVAKLVESSKRRKADAQRVLERRIIKEREREQQLYGNTERFVTPAYKKRLEENKRVTQMELREQNEQPSTQNVSAFYTRLLQVRVNREQENVSEENLPISETEPTERLKQKQPEEGKVLDNSSSYTAHQRSHVESSPPHIHISTEPNESKPILQSTASSHQTRPAQITTHGDKTEQVAPKKKRGLRRNTPQSIEAYRKRYFERRAKRLAADKTRH